MIRASIDPSPVERAPASQPFSTAARQRARRTARIGAACLVLALFLGPRLARAQTPQADPRWHPWIGCWSSSQNGLTGAAARVCVVPAAGASAVDIVTLANGRIASREHIEANGERRTSQRDGCNGWETARWSSDGRRIYLQSEHECSAGTKRSSDGLITMSPQGDWLDVISVTMGTNTGVRVLRHRATVEPTDLPAEVASPLHTVTVARVRDARAVAAAPLAIAEIVDASHQVSAGVVAAWLNDVRQEFDVNAKRLIELADAKVPDRVIDMLVALAYPDAFSVPPSPTTAGALAVNEPGGGGGGGGEFGFGGVSSFDTFGCADDFSVFGFGGCAPYTFGYSPFGNLSYGYLPFSYSRYGYGAFGGFGGAYGGWYDTVPVVIIRPDGGSHGQVVNGRGYTSGSSGTSTATGSGSGNSSSGSSGSSGGSSGGSVGTSSTGGGGGGGGGDRTAHPR